MRSVPSHLRSHTDDHARTRAAACQSRLPAQRQGDAAALAFIAWLQRWWVTGLMPPHREPDAITLPTAGLRTIRWYREGSTLLGFGPRPRGGYRIPLQALPIEPAAGTAMRPRRRVVTEHVDEIA